MALAMNRYIGSAMLPLLTRCAPHFAGSEQYASLVDSTLHTVYRLSKGRSLTKAQRDAIEECLLAVCRWAALTRSRHHAFTPITLTLSCLGHAGGELVDEQGWSLAVTCDLCSQVPEALHAPAAAAEAGV